MIKKLTNKILYYYLLLFHKDLFRDLNSHSWPRGNQLKQQIDVDPHKEL